MIYLDNSSTTHKKPLSVQLATLSGVRKYSINPSRGGYKLAYETAQKVYETRELLSSYYGTSPDQVIFTSGCTMALNLAINGTIKKGGHIITTIYEHNSVLRVLDKLKNDGIITYTVIEPNKNGLISPAEISRHIMDNTYMVIINHTSNVTGITQNIEAIGKVCSKHNLLLLVDGAQSVGHEKIDMSKYNINMLTLAGHKGLYASHGIGALLINNTKVSPIILGGTGTYSNKLKQPTDYPEGLESGTQNFVGILSLRAGIKYIKKHEININKKITKLTKYLIDNLNNIKNVTCYSTYHNAGVVSFTIKDKSSSYVSNLLDEEYNIATRSGLHCAPLVHKYYNTIKNGMTRISISYFNSKRDIDRVIEAIKKIALNK